MTARGWWVAGLSPLAAFRAMAAGRGASAPAGAGSGATLWSAHVADPTPHGEFIMSSPAVSTALGKLYLGTASVTACDLVAGRIAAVDLASHAVTERYVLPQGRQGAGIWSSIS